MRDYNEVEGNWDFVLYNTNILKLSQYV